MEIPNFFYIFAQNNWRWVVYYHNNNKIRNMKIIWNRILPFQGFLAMSVGPWIFARKEYQKQGLSKYTINHESLHWEQQKDFFIPVIGSIVFYLWYLVEWILKLPFTLFGYDAYRSISFEQEAYNYQYNLDYIKTRKKFNWLQYVFKLVK